MSFTFHQRNFSTSTNTTTTTSGKSEVFSTFEDDDEDSMYETAASKKKLRLRILLAVLSFVLIAGGIGGGVAYIEVKKVQRGSSVLDTQPSSTSSESLASSSANTLRLTFASTTTSEDVASSTVSTTISMKTFSFGSARSSSTPESSSITSQSTTYIPESTPYPSSIDHITPSIFTPDATTTPLYSETPNAVISSSRITPPLNPIFSIAPAKSGTSATSTTTSKPKPTVEIKVTSPSPSTTVSIGSLSPSPSTSSNEVNVQLNTFFSREYNGVLTHSPGSPTSSSPLACGDVYASPANTLFAALCHDTFDQVLGSSSITSTNSNKSPTCGKYVEGRKDLNGKWIEKGNGADYVVVGGDDALNCVGIEGVKCHVPLTISITYQTKTIKNVMIVDRNQGAGKSPCSSGDIDASDLVYRTLAGTNSNDSNSGLGINLKDISWIWE